MTAKSIRTYLTGGRTAGVRAPAGADPFEQFVDFVRARLAEDPHLWATVLCEPELPCRPGALQMTTHRVESLA